MYKIIKSIAYIAVVNTYQNYYISICLYISNNYTEYIKTNMYINIKSKIPKHSHSRIKTDKFLSFILSNL